MKTTRWFILVLLVIALSLTACGPQDEPSTSEEAEKPKESERTQDESMEKDDDEPVDEPVDSTLLDAEKMVDILGDYLLRPGDLTEEYSIPEGGEQRMATIRLIQEMGEIEAKTYVKETGRIDGWWLEIQRKNKDDFAPNTFESTIELFDSEDGPRTAISPEHFQLHKDESREYRPVAGGCDLGDHCEFYYSEREEPTTEMIIVQYDIAFTYKNAFVWILARGLEYDMDADYIIEAAEKVLEKLESAPEK